MPDEREPISADARGLILGAGTEHEWVQPWGEICRLLGEREDYGIGQTIRITLDHINGDFFELLDDDPGFVEVRERLARFLPDLDHDWYNRILARQVNDPDAPAVLWQRA